MKARIENNKIVLYNNIPKKLENSISGCVLGNYDKLSKNIHELDGFYDIVEPEYDPILQEVNYIYFDENNKIFTYKVIDKNFNLNVEKNKKIKKLKELSNEEFSKTDWYYIRKLRNGIDIPIEIENKSRDLYYKIEQIENEINNIDNIRDLLTYEINLDI